MKLIFKEDTHEYFYGDKKLISVTQLMRKHKLSPDYSNIPTQVLNRKAERGTLIHKEIEDYIKLGEFGFTQELDLFINTVKEENLQVLGSEVKVYNDVCAGTIDLIIKNLSDNQLSIEDIKTTSVLHYDAVSWQLSIYLYLLDKENYEKYIGKVMHFNDYSLDHKLIVLKPKVEVEKLMECERKGEMYRFDSLDYQVKKLEEVELFIANVQKQADEYIKQATEMREELYKAMVANGLKNYDGEKIHLSIRSGGVAQTFDSKRFKEEHPDIYKNYIKQTTKKDSLIIKIKEN